MNQLHDAEAGNTVPEGATGGQANVIPPPPTGVPLPLPPRQDPANVNIVNEYNSFNLTT